VHNGWRFVALGSRWQFLFPLAKTNVKVVKKSYYLLNPNEINRMLASVFKQAAGCAPLATFYILEFSYLARAVPRCQQFPGAMFPVGIHSLDAQLRWNSR
jgi:hypothetical protein